MFKTLYYMLLSVVMFVGVCTIDVYNEYEKLSTIERVAVQMHCDIAPDPSIKQKFVCTVIDGI